MDDPDPDPPNRRRFRADGSDVTVREDIEGEDDMMEVRMPIASTGEVRNAGDDPLTRDELAGMADQLQTREVGVFPSHGDSDKIAFERYSPFERLGDWTAGELETREDAADVLMATARMPDPETLPAATGDYREALAILKEQAVRGIGMDASIGWREDDAFPGGVDLMEASIVGIGADWRTNTGDEAAETVARAAVDAGADPDALVARVRAAVAPEDGRPLGPPEDPDRFDTFEECVNALQENEDLSREEAERICGSWEADKDNQSAGPLPDMDSGPDGSGMAAVHATHRAEYEVGDTTVDITPPDAMQNAAALALEKSQAGLGEDCGTGVGSDRAQQIVNDEVGPDVIDEVAAYLTSHEEDVTADGPPSDWSDEEWDDCGNMQYAKWGGLGTGTALEWAQGKANEVAEARDEDLPYPERGAHNLDDPAFAEGDAVMWSFQGESVHGRVADIGDQFTVSGNTITGEEGEAVYLIHEWDEDVEAFRSENVAKPESSLEESQMEMPPASEENFADADTPDDGMTDDDTGDAESAGTTDAQDAPDAGDEQTDDDPEQTQAPDDIALVDWAELLASHIEGVDSADLMDAWEPFAEDYIGEVNVPELASFVAAVVDASTGEVEDAMADLAGEEQAGEGMDDDEEDEDDEADEQYADDSDLAERVADLEAALADVRAGETGVATPGEDGDDTDTDTDGERDAEADADGDDADEQRDTTDAADDDPAHWRETLNT